MGYREVILGDKPISYWRLGDAQAGAPVVIQTAPVAQTQSTSGAVTATLTNTPSAASILIAICCGLSTGTAGFTASPLSWTWDATEGHTTDVTIGHVASDGATKAFTFTETNPFGGSAADRWVILMEVGGLVASPTDHIVVGSFTNSPWAGALSANSNLNGLEIFAVGLEGGTVPITPGMTNGFTPTLETGSAAAPNSLIWGVKAVSAADTPSTSVSWVHSSAAGAGVGVSYKGLVQPGVDQINGLNALAGVGGLQGSYEGAIVGDNDGGGGAAHFDGTTAYLGTSSPLSIPAAAAACTCEAWTRPQSTLTTTGAGGPVLNFGKATNVNGGRYFLLQNISGTVFIFSDGVNGGNNITITSAQYPPPGVWNHIVWTITAAGVFKWYVNGVLVVNTTVTLNTDAAAVLRIGTRSDTGSGFFFGGLDDVALYPTVLTQGQVQAHYNAGLRALRTGSRDYRRRR